MTSSCIVFIEGSHFLWIDSETFLPLKESNLPFYEISYTNYKINEQIPASIFAIPEGEITEEIPCNEEERGPDGNRN